jgi:HK97 family phage portal protein
MTDLIEQFNNMEEIEKADVTLVPPGSPIKIALLGPEKNLDVLDYNKVQEYSVYSAMYTNHPWVRAAIDKIADYAVKAGFIFVPEDPNETVDPAAQRKLKRFFRNSSEKQLVRITLRDILVYGEGFWLVERNLTGAPFRGIRLIPKMMRPAQRNEKGFVTKWRYGSNISDDTSVVYDDRFILHFKIDDLEDDIGSMSKLRSLKKSVAADLNAQEFNGMFFENGAQTGIVFTMDAIDAASAKRNREYLEQKYVGTYNAHRPVLLEGGVKVEKSVATAQEMQFVELRRVNRMEILGVLGVDPTKLGILEDANRSTAKESEDTFHTETVDSIVSIIEEEINNKLILGLFRMDDILFQFNRNDPRQQASMLETYGNAEMKGIFTVDEIRAKLGMGTVPGGNIPIIQTAAGMMPLSMITQMAEKMLQQADLQKTAGEGIKPTPKKAEQRTGNDPER